MRFAAGWRRVGDDGQWMERRLSACNHEAVRSFAIARREHLPNNKRYTAQEEMATFRAKIISVLAAVLGLSLAYAGCSPREPVRKSAPPFVRMQTKFDYLEHEPYAKLGANGISGQAFLKQQGDSVVTCAGSRVLLLPATSYFREMFWHIIITGSDPEPPATPYPSLKSMIRRTQCDAQGNFSFPEIPDGTWFILTQVNARDGGVLITEVTLSNRRTTPVLLTDKHLVGR